MSGRAACGELIYLIRPCRSTYMDKHGMRRALKPNIVHGAWVVGPATRERLSHTRKYTDIEVPLHAMPLRLAAAADHNNITGTFFDADRLRKLGWPIPPVPLQGWRRAWWLFWQDAGAAR